MREIAEHAATWRKLRGLTQVQVADRAGVSRDTVLRLEDGTGNISVEKLLRILRALGVMDGVAGSVDPYATDLGRLRADEQLPKRVRPKRLDMPTDAHG